MKVFIKNKLMSIGDGSSVLNENNEPLYNVKGKLISPTKKKFMYDLNGNLLYTIRNKYWTFFCDKVIIYDAENNKVATIKKNKFSFNLKYQILDSVDEMSIEGKFFRGTSNILRNGEVAGVITRDFSIIKDSFILTADEKDIPFFTAIVIAFDNIRDKKDKDLHD